MELSIIIVSYNTAGILKKCLEALFLSLKQTEISRTEVIIVDNGSNDGSAEMVGKYFPQAIVIPLRKNLGFSGGNNLGILKSTGRYILLLNSDTQVNSETIPELLKTLTRDGKIGAAGCKLLNSDGTVQPSAGYFPSIVKVFYWMMFIDDLPFFSGILNPYHIENKNFYNRIQQVDWVSGACIMVSRSAVRTAGVLDENIFMYGEEVDWCFRIKKEGFKIIYTPEASLYHFKGASGSGLNSGIIEEFSFLNYFYAKWKPVIQQKTLKLLLFTGALLRLIVFGIICRQKGKARLYAKILAFDRR